MYMSGVSLIVQYLTNLGILAQAAQLNTYVGGSVSTPVTTYTDSTGLVSNPNPMTLNAAGRPGTPSGAPAAFWVPGGTVVKLVVFDAQNNLLVSLDNIPAINDFTNFQSSLASMLASAASSNSSGVGPVAGADLVANAVKSYDVFADVRAANVPTLVSGQTLNIEVQGGLAVGDGLGGFFYWAPSATGTDDGRTIITPTSESGNGRWLRYYPLGVPFIITKPSDQSVVSSTTLVTDSALTAQLAVGTYLVQPRLILLGSTATGQGWKVNIAFGGSLAAVSQGTGVTTANASAAAAGPIIGSAFQQSSISDTTGDAVNLDFVLVVTGAGLLSVQFAQASSTANATTMKQGSSLLIRRLA